MAHAIYVTDGYLKLIKHLRQTEVLAHGGVDRSGWPLNFLLNLILFPLSLQEEL